MKLYSCLLALILPASGVLAQEYPREHVDVSQLADELYGQPDEDVNYEELYENLVQLMAHPIDLNQATAEDFSFLSILSEGEIKSLMKYRAENGRLLSVYELQSVPGLDLSTIYKLVPFVTVNHPDQRLDASVFKRIQEESDNYFLLRYERSLQTKNGFQASVDDDTRFRGSQDKLYLRFRSSKPGDFSFGCIAEKDPGEQLRWHPASRYYGTDYISYHIQLQNKGRLKNLVVGDFQGQFGQGLIFGGVFGMGKGSEPITTIRRSNIGLLPYTSLYESGAMRGLGFTGQLNQNFSITAFASKARRDATIVPSESGNAISSFQTTGLHRNNQELLTRKSITEKNVGGVLHYRRNSVDAGIMFNRIQYNIPVRRTPSVYNQFAFDGRVNQNVGLYFNYNINNLSFFSEIARSRSGGYAAVAGTLLSISPKLDVSLLYRRYDRDYHSFYANGFAENSNTQNEQGVYWGWKYSFNRRYNITGYIDLFKFPWLRFRSYTVSTGCEWLLRFNYEPSRKTKIFIQVREETKTRNMEADSVKQYVTSPGRKNNYAVSFDYSPHPMLRLKTRGQLSTYAIKGRVTSGTALMQDLILDIGKVKLTMRYGLFDTDDYDNRQYTYENDVWLSYALPAYYGTGIRKLVIVEYKLSKRMSFWLRYGQSLYRNQEYIGSAVDRINGSRKEDIKAQVVIRF